MAALPRVLLVEDDATLRRFVAMALEDMPIDLVQCDAVAPALALLAQDPFVLVLTDLMMPGESGFDLLEHLHRTPALRGRARVAVLSAGLTPEVREQLADMEVWRMLSKPVSVGTLVACVQDAIEGNAEAAAPDGLARQPQAGDRARMPCRSTSTATRNCSTPTAVRAWSSFRTTCARVTMPARRPICSPCGAWRTA